MATTARSTAAKSKAKSASKTAQKSAKATTTAKAKTASSKTAAGGKSNSGNNAAQISAEQRQIMIEEAAYFIAEQRGFAPGNPTDDWLAAEAHINTLLSSQ